MRAVKQMDLQRRQHRWQEVVDPPRGEGGMGLHQRWQRCCTACPFWFGRQQLHTSQALIPCLCWPTLARAPRLVRAARGVG
jgi:hypothetical protein